MEKKQICNTFGNLEQLDFRETADEHKMYQYETTMSAEDANSN